MTDHATAQALNFNWHAGQNGCCGCNEDQRHSGDTGERCSEVLTQLGHVSGERNWKTSEEAYKSGVEVTVKELGIGAKTESTNPARSKEGKLNK